MRPAFFVLLFAIAAVGCRFETRVAPEEPVAAAPAAPTPVPPQRLSADGKPEVVLYVTEWCPYCRAAREYMAAEDIPHRIVDIEKDTTGAQEYVALGGDGGIPLVAVGTNVMKGWSPEGARGMLDAAGYE